MRDYGWLLTKLGSFQALSSTCTYFTWLFTIVHVFSSVLSSKEMLREMPVIYLKVWHAKYYIAVWCNYYVSIPLFYAGMHVVKFMLLHTPIKRSILALVIFYYLLYAFYKPSYFFINKSLLTNATRSVAIMYYADLDKVYQCLGNSVFNASLSYSPVTKQSDWVVMCVVSISTKHFLVQAMLL